MLVRQILPKTNPSFFRTFKDMIRTFFLRKLTYLFFVLLFPFYGFAQQFSFQFDTEIPVTANGEALKSAWTGGLNAAQYQKMDLNNDQQEDLVIFDRTSGKISTFIKTGNRYDYQPDYEYLFPEGINNWMVLADYDCDGKKDIFTNTVLGIKVFRNISSTQLAWKLVADPIFTKSGSNNTNLQINQADIPGIVDMDNDGDLDILIFNFFGSGKIELNKNLSMETYGICDSLTFEKVTKNWGNFEECTCGNYAFGETCKEKNGRKLRPEHAGGKAILMIDQDGDDDKDLLFGDEFCEELVFFENQGTKDDAVLLDFNAEFPTLVDAAKFKFFPAGYYEDLDFDGIKDLVVAPNTAQNLGNLMEFRKSNWFYHNTGTNNIPNFEFVQKDFLQEEMLDFGEEAHPVFIDIDQDGDSDLLIGSRGYLHADGYYASFFLMENTGTSFAPVFELTDSDYLNIASLELLTLQPQFIDINADGNLDFVFSGAPENSFSKKIFYLLNQSNSGFDFSLSHIKELNATISVGDNYYLFDLDHDSDADLLVGKSTGRIEHYDNTGNNSFALITKEFMGRGNDIFKRTPAMTTADINGDGTLEMVMTDDTGSLRIYDDFLSQINVPQEGTQNLLTSSLTEDLLTLKLGRKSWPTLADLNGDGLPEMVIGSVQGGLQTLLNKGKTIGGDAPKLALKIYPNPLQSQRFVKIKVNDEAQIAIFSSLGQRLTEDISVKNSITKIFDFSSFANGIYIITATGKNKGTASEKLVISR